MLMRNNNLNYEVFEMKLELNKVYKFDLGDMAHCGMSHDEMIEHYKSNSSPMSFLCEKLLPKWFSDIYYESSPFFIVHKGKKIRIKPDLRDKKTKTILYDQKAFNRKGGSFVRSNMKGEGREYNKELNDIWAGSQIFIWTDFIELPEVRVIALTGTECVARWSDGKIKLKDREMLFK